MSSSGERTHLKLLTVGDLDPQADPAIEGDFIGRVIAGRYTVRAHIGGGGMADVFQTTDEVLGVFVEVLDEWSSRNLPATANTPGGPSVGWPGLRGSSGRAGRK